MAVKVRILGVPLDLGQTRRGVDMGPSAMRVAGLQPRLQRIVERVEDAGNLPVVIAETQEAGNSAARYLAEIGDVCQGTSRRVARMLERGLTPLVLGGDHSIAAGTVAGVSRHFRAHGQRVGLIWFDAHADMNTPDTTPSGSVHGMPLACCIGMGPAELTDLLGETPFVDPKNVALVGVRDIDPGEKENIRRAGIHLFTMREIDAHGLRRVLELAIKVACEGTAGFHVSLDMDVIDPAEAPGVGTPVPGGLTYREAHLAMESVADSGGMRSLEVVEVNPILDTANRTASLAVGLILSAFGKSIV